MHHKYRHHTHTHFMDTQHVLTTYIPYIPCIPYMHHMHTHTHTLFSFCTHIPHMSNQTQQAYNSYTPHTTYTSCPPPLPSRKQVCPEGSWKLPSRAGCRSEGSGKQHNCCEHLGNSDSHGNPWKNPKGLKERRLDEINEGEWSSNLNFICEN